MANPGKVVKTKLFIGNLDPATQPAELTELFGQFGSVLEASVIKDYGFVHYGSVEEAEKAVAGLNNKEFHGKRLRVELSTSTVRHRPGQPEPASALRHSRARNGGTAGNANGGSRYGAAAPPPGGVGPMRHHGSAWARHDARPYGHMPRDPGPMPPDYVLESSPYDRSRAYDPRAEPRRYYGDERDHGYAPGYDTSPYGSSGRGAGEPVEMSSGRNYRDLPPHARGDPAGYGANRAYDRYGELPPPPDPYYESALPLPPPGGDSYRNYEMYSKYYGGRSRDSEYPGSAAAPPSARDYDPYSNYRPDPYGPPSGPATFRHHSNVAPPPSQHQGVYPGPPHRQQALYGSGSSASASAAGAPPYPPASYYGAHPRA